MNNFTKKDLMFGTAANHDEIYCQFIDIPLTKKEKIKIFFHKVKELIVEILWHLLISIGVTLQLSALAYLAGIFFKIGVNA